MKVTKDLIPQGRANRPGGVNPTRYITIHETDNTDRGANARAHASYLKSTSDKVSWHYTVDDHSIYQHLPNTERAFHAGDGRNGTGNAQSIGIELCVNRDGDFAKTMRNTAELVRTLRRQYGIPIANVVQHNRWNGKDCPRTMRKTGKWAELLAQCRDMPTPAASPNINTAAPSSWAKASWDKARAKGITDGLRPHDSCTREELMVILNRLGVL